MRKTRAVLLPLVLAVLPLLAGCGGGGGRPAPVTKMQTLIDGALAVVRKDHPAAVLLAARGATIANSAGRSLADVTGWVFIFDDGKQSPQSLYVEWNEGVYGEAYWDDGDDGDTMITQPPVLDFDVALARLGPAGFPMEFDGAGYRFPIDLTNKEPFYVFHIAKLRRFVMVGARTGQVRSESDHENLMNTVIGNTLEYAHRTFPAARSFTVDADVDWIEDRPYANVWHIELNNPATNPPTTLTMEYAVGQPLEPPVVEQRMLSGLTSISADLVLDPTEVIEKLQDAGYTGEFTRIGVRRPSGASEPVYRFVFPGAVVHVGATTGIVTKQ